MSRPLRSPRSLRRLAATAAVGTALVVAAGCGDADEPGAGSDSGSQATTAASDPLEGVTIQEALDAPGKLVVHGWVVDAGGSLRLCTTRIEGDPPGCGEPSLLLDGYAGTISAIQELDVAGTVDDKGTLVFDPASLLDKGNAG